MTTTHNRLEVHPMPPMFTEDEVAVLLEEARDAAAYVRQKP